MTARSITPLDSVSGAAKGRILIVVNDKVVADAIRRAAAANGNEVVGVCEDPRHGLAAAHEMRPNLVVSGIFFSGEPEGLELSRHIQFDLGLPVVFVGQSDDPLLTLQISMAQPAGLVPDLRDQGYLQAVIARALKGVRTAADSPY